MPKVPYDVRSLRRASELVEQHRLRIERQFGGFTTHKENQHNSKMWNVADRLLEILNEEVETARFELREAARERAKLAKAEKRRISRLPYLKLVPARVRTLILDRMRVQHDIAGDRQ